MSLPPTFRHRCQVIDGNVWRVPLKRVNSATKARNDGADIGATSLSSLDFQGRNTGRLKLCKNVDGVQRHRFFEQV